MNRKWLFFFLLIISTTATTGCWNKKEIKELAIVSAFAIDKNQDGKYVGTFQIINAGNLTGPLQGGSGDNPPVTVYTSTGENLMNLSTDVSKKASRDLYFAHSNLLVIGEKLAKEEGITKIFDVLERSPEFRTTTKVVIARNSKAASVLKILTTLDKLPSNNVIKTVQNTEEFQGENISVNIQKVVSDLISSGKEPLISGLKVMGKEKKGENLEGIQSTKLHAQLIASGIGVFKNGKLIDWLDGKKANGTVWGLNRIKHTEVMMDWEKEKDAIDYHVVRQKTNISSEVKKGSPKISINVLAEGDIREVRIPVDLTDPLVLQDIEKKVEKVLKKEIEDAVYLAQKNKADVFGFGEVIHQSHPKVWKKVEKDWNDRTFPKLEVDIKVNAFIRRTGLKTKSFLSQ